MARPHPLNKTERSAQVAELMALPALSMSDMAVVLDMSVAGLDKLRAEGNAPRMFKIGRRLFSKRDDFLKWIDELAKTEA